MGTMTRPCTRGGNAPVYLCIDSIRYKLYCQPSFSGRGSRRFPSSAAIEKKKPEGFVTTYEAAVRTQRSGPLVREWTLKGWVRSVKCAGHLYVSMADVEQFSQAHPPQTRAKRKRACRLAL